MLEWDIVVDYGLVVGSIDLAGMIGKVRSGKSRCGFTKVTSEEISTLRAHSFRLFAVCQTGQNDVRLRGVEGGESGTLPQCRILLTNHTCGFVDLCLIR